MAAPPPHHQAPPVHMAPMDMRAPPIGEPRNVMGDPRVPMMEPRAPPMETRGTAALTRLQSLWSLVNIIFLVSPSWQTNYFLKVFRPNKSLVVFLLRL